MSIKSPNSAKKIIRLTCRFLNPKSKTSPFNPKSEIQTSKSKHPQLNQSKIRDPKSRTPACPASCPVVLWGRSPKGEAPSSKSEARSPKGEEGNPAPLSPFFFHLKAVRPLLKRSAPLSFNLYPFTFYLLPTFPPSHLPTYYLYPFAFRLPLSKFPLPHSHFRIP